MRKINKLVFILIVALMFVPSFTMIANASEPNLDVQRISDEELQVLPTKVWVTRGGDSLLHGAFMFYQEGDYRGWLARTELPSYGWWVDYEGYIYRKDLPYPAPYRIEPIEY